MFSSYINQNTKANSVMGIIQRTFACLDDKYFSIILKSLTDHILNMKTRCGDNGVLIQ